MSAPRKAVPAWPDGRRFAFTIFDDPDSQSLEIGREVYACLADLGFRTTKGVWPLRADGAPSDPGGNCEDPAYRDWTLSLQAQGFEIGYHNASQKTEPRERTREGLDRFRALFGDRPITMSNHYNSREAVYFGPHRLDGLRRRTYDLLTRGTNRNASRGHVEGDPLFWGDLCAERIGYCRNFAFRDADTLQRVPFMPYHDPRRPYVRAWYASTDCSNAGLFLKVLTPAAIESVAERGSACIVYTHFGHGYMEGGRLRRDVRSRLEAIASLGGWYVPVGTLLDHLATVRGVHTVTDADLAPIEWRWLVEKIRYGTS